MKRKIVSALMIISLLTGVFSISAFAAEISEISPNLPEVELRIKADKGTFKSENQDKIKVTLDGKELTVNSAAIENELRINYYVFLDTSISTNTYFQSEKDAILELYKAKGENDKLVLYTFAETTKQILTGAETYEQAKKKVDAVKCDGQDTVLYDSLNKMVSTAAQSDSDETYCLLFTDGVDTLSKKTEADTEAKLKEAKYPVVAFYPDKNKEENSKNLNSLLSLTGGKATAFSSKDATEKLKAINPNKSETIIIKAATSEGIEANESAVVTVDLGDGKVLNSNTSIKESWGIETTTEETTAEVTEPTTPEPEEEGSNLLMIIAPVVLVLLVIALVLIKVLGKKRQKANEKDDEDDDDDEVDEKLTSYYHESDATDSDPDSDENEAAEDESSSKKSGKKGKKSKDDKKPEMQSLFYFEDKK